MTNEDLYSHVEEVMEEYGHSQMSKWNHQQLVDAIVGYLINSEILPDPPPKAHVDFISSSFDSEEVWEHGLIDFDDIEDEEE